MKRTGEDLEDLSPMIVAGWIEEEPRAVIIAKYEKQAVRLIFVREIDAGIEGYRGII